MPTSFGKKAEARQAVWDRLYQQGIALPPGPPHGRIPNFTGAEAAARRLLDAPLLAAARVIKCNPDTPQWPVRRLALARGIRVYVPTPRLTGGFHLLDPAVIEPGDYAAAAKAAEMTRFSSPVRLEELPQFDVIVAGSVTVTDTGRRCGKGAGFSDIEFGILRELGHAPAPVVTTVHDAQVVDDIPVEPNDQPLTLIGTPTRLLAIGVPDSVPEGIDWSLLDEAGLAEMTVLSELKQLQAARGGDQ